jgi:hypothetical protein
MSLFPEENISTRGIESWKTFADDLKSEDDRKMFLEMLKCQKYALAINAKGEPFPTEPLIMALLLEQHKMINWLQRRYPSLSKDSLNIHKISDNKSYLGGSLNINIIPTFFCFISCSVFVSDSS